MSEVLRYGLGNMKENVEEREISECGDAAFGHCGSSETEYDRARWEQHNAIVS